MSTKRSAELHLAEDMVFQRRQWRTERFGWTLLVLFLLAGFAGLFGSGPLSRAKVGEPGALELEYERFVRHHRNTELKITLGPPAIAAGEARVLIDRDYLSSLQVERITPEPERMEPAREAILLVFPARDADSVEITLHIRPETLWQHPGFVGIPGAQPIVFSQFTYP